MIEQETIIMGIWVIIAIIKSRDFDSKSLVIWLATLTIIFIYMGW